MKAGWWDALALCYLAEAINTTRSKILYSLIEPQALFCTLACGNKFYALAVHPHPTFIAPLVRSALGIRSEVCGGAFCGNSLSIKAVGWFGRGAPSLMFYGIINVTLLRRRLPPPGLHRGILNSSCILILPIDTKHKYKNMKSWTDATSSFSRKRTHTFGRQGKKRVANSWAAAHKSWDDEILPVGLRDFSQGNKHEDSHKESPWFPAFPTPFLTFPLWFPPFLVFPTWFPTFPPPFPAFPPWFLTFAPWFPAFPHWFPRFPSFPSFRSPIPHSGFYR